MRALLRARAFADGLAAATRDELDAARLRAFTRRVARVGGASVVALAAWILLAWAGSFAHDAYHEDARGGGSGASDDGGGASGGDLIISLNFCQPIYGLSLTWPASRGAP